MKNRKKLTTLFALFVIVFTGYWLKNQLGINIIKTVSFSRHFPFKYFYANVIANPKTGVLLYEDFDKGRLVKVWSDLWMKEEGKVTKEISSNGINNSKCLLIVSISHKSWAYENKKYIEVKRGEIFDFGGYVKISGEKTRANLGVATFDENKKVIHWDYAVEEMSVTDTWVKIEQHFSINENINYIKFRLTGSGVGNFRFDNISISKL